MSEGGEEFVAQSSETTILSTASGGDMPSSPAPEGGGAAVSLVSQIGRVGGKRDGDWKGKRMTS